MKKLISLMFVLLFACGCGGEVRFFDTPEPLITEPPVLMVPEPYYYGETYAVIKIHASKAIGPMSRIGQTGTGFFLKQGKNTYLVTAYHVIEDADLYEFYDSKNRRIYVGYDKQVNYKKADCTVFRVTTTSAKINPFESSSYSLGDSCMVRGYPQGNQLQESRGSIVNFQIGSSCVVDHGMSGGPLIKDGKVVGVITSMVRTSDIDGLRSIHVPIIPIIESLK